MGTFIGNSPDTRNVITVLNAARLAGANVILSGPPGVGKTALIRAIAERENLPLEILIPATMDPTDVDGLPALKEIKLPNGDVATITENTLPHWAHRLIEAGSGILFIDELSSAVPSVQAALLSLLQGRRVGKHTLPEGVWIITAQNPSSDTGADFNLLSAPLANRLIHLNYEFNFEDYIDGLQSAWGDDVPDAEKDSRAIVSAFLKQHPTLAMQFPDTASEAAGAWASPRTWDKLTTVLANIPASEPLARNMAITGTVGKAVATQFNEFVNGLRLPPYEKMLNEPESIQWSKFNAGEAITIISMVTERVTYENAAKSGVVFSKMAESHPDIAQASVVKYIKTIKNVYAAEGKSASTKENVALFSLVFKKFGTILAEAGLVGRGGIA